MLPSLLTAILLTTSDPSLEERIQAAVVYVRQRAEPNPSMGEILQLFRARHNVVFGRFEPRSFAERYGREDPNLGLRLGLESNPRQGIAALNPNFSSQDSHALRPMDLWAQFLLMERLSLLCVPKEKALNDKVVSKLQSLSWPSSMRIAKFRVATNFKVAGCLSKKTIQEIYQPLYRSLLLTARNERTPPGTLSVILFEIARAGETPPHDLIERLKTWQDPDGGWWDPDDSSAYPTLAGLYVLVEEFRRQKGDPANLIAKSGSTLPFLPLSQYKYRTTSPAATLLGP